MCYWGARTTSAAFSLDVRTTGFRAFRSATIDTSRRTCTEWAPGRGKPLTVALPGKDGPLTSPGRTFVANPAGGDSLRPGVGAGMLAGGSWRQRRLASLVSSAMIGAGFVPVWIAAAVLVVVAQIIAPETLSGISFSAVLPLMSFLAVAALGEMLVVMTGGIDLSIPGVITLAGIVVVGSADGANDKLAVAILICLGWSALIGLVNGVLVAVAGLNPLIVTLAVGQIVLGIANERHDQIVVESAVPPALSDWAQHKVLGISLLFWTGSRSRCCSRSVSASRSSGVASRLSARTRTRPGSRASRSGVTSSSPMSAPPCSTARRASCSPPSPRTPGSDSATRTSWADRGRRDRRRLARRRTRQRDFDLDGGVRADAAGAAAACARPVDEFAVRRLRGGDCGRDGDLRRPRGRRARQGGEPPARSGISRNRRRLAGNGREEGEIHRTS